MSLPEYRFTSSELADYVDKVRVAWEGQRAAEIERLRAAVLAAKPFVKDDGYSDAAKQVNAMIDAALNNQQQQPEVK